MKKTALTFLLLFNLPAYSQSRFEDGLVAYYPFNGNANDESGNENHGIVNGPTLSNDRNGMANSAYYFDGVNDFINIGRKAILKRENSSFSISAWVNLETFSSSSASVIISNRNRLPSGYIEGSVFGMHGKLGTPGKFAFTTKGGNNSVTVVSDKITSLGSWNHIVITFEYKGGSSNVVTLYCNGEVTAKQLTVGFVEPLSTDTYIGFEPIQSPIKEYHFRGKIDEVKIHNRVISEAEVLNEYINEADLIASYSFTGNALDAGVYQTHGVVNGATLTKDRFGNINSAYYFDGVDDYINLGKNPILKRFKTSFSISTWVNLDGSSNKGPSSIISNKAVGGSQLYINQQTPGSGTITFTGANEATNTSLNSEISLNSWTHICITVEYNDDSENVARTYVNGQLVQTVLIEGIQDPGDLITLIGAAPTSPNYSSFFKGIIDEIDIYKKVLGPKEIVSIFNRGELISFYPFNGDAKDESGYGNHGEVRGATLVADRFGNSNSAFQFDGVDDYINIGNNPILKKYNTNYSITAWINIKEYSKHNVGIILSNRSEKHDGTLTGVGGETSFKGKLTSTLKGGSSSITIASLNDIEVNKWVHIGVTFEFKGAVNNILKVYINGALERSLLVPITLDPGSNNNYIGFEASTISPIGYHFKGIIDDIRIYNKVIHPFLSDSADFRSTKSGRWDDYDVWEVFNGEHFEPAELGEIPKMSNNVFLGANNTIALSQNASCKDLHLNSTNDVVRLNTQEYTLDVYGKIRSFVGDVPGTNSTSAGAPNWITTGTNGKIRLKGTSNRVITEKDEFSDHENLKDWTLECDLAEGVIGTINSNFRVGNVVITSGNLEVKSKNFKVSK